jgi:hypothetical protein
MPGEKRQVGKVTHFFGKIHLASIELTDTLKVGDIISIEGPRGALEQSIDSMRLDNRKVPEAGAGAGVGIKVNGKVKVGDSVFVIG